MTEPVTAELIGGWGKGRLYWMLNPNMMAADLPFPKTAVAVLSGLIENPALFSGLFVWNPISTVEAESAVASTKTAIVSSSTIAKLITLKWTLLIVYSVVTIPEAIS